MSVSSIKGDGHAAIVGVLVLEGRRLRFAPEVYPTQLRAEREAYRWGWFLGNGEESRIQIVGRTSLAGRSNSRPTRPRANPGDSLGLRNSGWASVGESTGNWRRQSVFLDRYKAMAWLRSIPRDQNIKPGTKDHTMYLSVTVKRDDGEVTGLAYQAKVAASFDSAIAEFLPEIPEAVDYEIDLTATFSHVIHTTIRAEPGLTAEGISERIDREFPNLVGYQGQLVDAEWELEEFRQIGGRRPRPSEEDDQA